MESQFSFGGEQLAPGVGSEAAPEKQQERPKKVVLPETVWARVDPNHLQLPEPKPKKAVEAKQAYETEGAKIELPKEVIESAKSSQPESLADLLKAQALPNLDIRPQHFNADAEVRSARSSTPEHDILPEISREASHTKVEQFNPQAVAESNPVVQQVSPEVPAKSELNLDRHELLLLAGTISAEGTNLLEIFNTNRIDEDGLRRIVAEFMQGRPIEKLLEQEELREQMKFELDPSLRHSPEVTDSLASRLASGTLNQSKKVVNPQRIKQHVGNATRVVAGGMERMLEARDTPPSPAKIIAWTVGTILYFVVLIWALRR